MKNRYFTFLFAFIFYMSSLNAEIYRFETSNIQIEEKVIIAGKGKAYSSDNKIEIKSDEFKYFKDSEILESRGNGYFIIKSKNLKVFFDKSTFDKKRSIINAIGNVRIDYQNKNLLIEAENIFYDENKALIFSNSKTLINDNINNNYIVDNFIFEIDKDILKLNKLILTDSDKNILKTDLAYLNTKSGKMFGKDIKINFSKKFNTHNEPRLRGNSVVRDDNTTTLKKGIFTNCKKRDGCPPWQIHSEEIKHDKKNKIINYKNAFLKVYDFPIFYFPKFFHPDPTVKRQSGFLTPSLSYSQNNDNFVKTPYFFAIADDKDITLSPRFYNDDKFLLQSEYRDVNINSDHIVDISYNYDNDGNSNNHLFYNYKKKLDLNRFNDSKLKFQIQRTSNDTYLKKNKISGQIIDDNEILENSFGIDLYSNNLSINIESIIYKDLNKLNNDRYEYIYPKINLTKIMQTNKILNGEFALNSEILARNYNTNVYENNNFNSLKFNSESKLTSLGFVNDYEFLIKNLNSKNKNTSYKNKKNAYISGIFQYNSSLPLKKKKELSQSILAPKLSLKYSPGTTKKDINNNEQIDINNVYSIDRISGKDTTEKGFSATYGSDYSYYDNSKSREILGIQIASNFRINENDNLPNLNQIGEKNSNIFSNILYSPNETFNLEYRSSFKNNLSDINYENLTSSFNFRKFNSSFSYTNENNTISKTSIIENETNYQINDNNFLQFSTRKNKTYNLTEYYNLIYSYQNDCLEASIEYNKDFYRDRDIGPSENLLFKLTITPLAQINSPNLIKK